MLDTFRFIARHPLTQKQLRLALVRYLRWQIGSRLSLGPIAVPFAGDARLLVRPGMKGATGNIYVGLHEFHDMAFVVHALRRDDLFADLGANIGSYTILASKVAGADCLAVEPAPSTFAHLLDNIHLNAVGDCVDAKCVALGREPGRAEFTTDRDAMNRISSDGATSDSVVEVPVCRLDDLLGERVPRVIKIDVEGYETPVFEGAERVLGDPTLCAIVMETNGSGAAYGFDESALIAKLEGHGFAAYSYDPVARVLTPQRESNSEGNTIYVRDADTLRPRLAEAPRIDVLGQSI